MDNNTDKVLIEDNNTNQNESKHQLEQETGSLETHLARKSLDIGNYHR